MQNKQTLDYLETLLTMWQAQFDEKPNMENLSFHVDNHGMIILSGHTICAQDILSTEEYDVHPDHFHLFFSNGDYLTIEILWTYTESPVVSAICLHHMLFQLEE